MQTLYKHYNNLENYGKGHFSLQIVPCSCHGDGKRSTYTEVWNIAAVLPADKL